MKNKFLLSIIPILWLSNNSFTLAQGDPNQQAEIQHCLTMEMDSLLRKKNPALGNLTEFELDLQDKMALRERWKRQGKTTAEVITIPVVVHVIHNGEAVGQGKNISAAQVQAQIDVLNEDFRRKAGSRGFNTNPRGADIEIEFCLAQLDPKGNIMPEPGIHRYNGQKAVWQYTEVDARLKPATSWDPNKYFNIWVVNFEGSTAGGTVLGYAQFPTQSTLPGLSGGATGEKTDGVVILTGAFGSTDKGSFPNMISGKDKGRVLTHEVGHWLGLRHIWGDGDCSADDFVSDTPTADGPNYGCPRGSNSCGSTDMIENYMDYTDDACMNIFTIGQKERMLTVMQFSPRRASLLTSNVCGTQAVAAPIANFRADRIVILRGGTVNFTDISANFPSQWQWTFEGGEPSTSNTRNPSVVYNTPGTYSVTLTVSNELGSSTITRQNYIIVSEEGLCSNGITNFPDTAARVVLKAPLGDVASGYIAGHNNLKRLARSEFFANTLGYTNLNKVALRFGQAITGDNRDDATVTVLAWNARGFQGSPGAVLERKEVLLSQIQQDIANNVPTEVIFDRNIPLFGQSFHVGIQLDYSEGDTIALVTTRNGSALFGTAWEQDSTGQWSPYTISQGLNIAHDITAYVGMYSSVQLSSSELIINPGDFVTINARGASIFSWEQSPSLSATQGPQVIASPTETTTYTVTGGGSELCDSTASITIMVRAPTSVGPNPNLQEEQLKVFPNPSSGKFTLALTNPLLGPVELAVYNAIGNKVLAIKDVKQSPQYEKEIDLSLLPDGVYIISFTLNNTTIRKKIVIVNR